MLVSTPSGSGGCHWLVRGASSFVRERTRVVVAARAIQGPAVRLGSHCLERRVPAVALDIVGGHLLKRAAVGGEGPAPPSADGVEESGRWTPGPPVSVSPGSERLARPSRCEDGPVCFQKLFMVMDESGCADAGEKSHMGEGEKMMVGEKSG